MGKKTKLACEFCKLRKKRCDGEEPICGRCSARGFTSCTYSYHLDRRRPVSKDYIHSLEQQIRILKAEVEQLRSKESMSESNIVLDSDQISQISSESKWTSLSDRNHIRKAVEEQEAPSEFLEELIDRFGKFHYVGHGSYRFYGPRSIMSFLDEGSQFETGEDTKRSTQIPSDLSSSERLFMDLYFCFQNSLLVFVWKDLFEQQRDLPIASRDNQLFSDGLFNAILAVGSLFDPNSGEGLDTRGNFYANLACKQLQEEIKAPRLTTVQIAGILSVFYVYKAKDELAWHYCGIAVTTSYTLGLNVDDSISRGSGTSNKDELVEMRKIAFWATFFLDKVLNSMLGRPTLLKSSSITCTVPIGIGLRECHIWKDPSGLSFSLPASDSNRFCREYSQFSFTIELFILVEKPLNDIYLFFKPSAPRDLEMTVAKATTNLLDFELSLPYFMRLNFLLSFQARAKLCPGLFYFQIRLNYTHIMLNRVFFIREQNMENDINSKMRHYQMVCYKSAVKISRIAIQYGKIFGFYRVDVFVPDMICTAAILLLYLIRNYTLAEMDQEDGFERESVTYYMNLKHCLRETSKNNLWGQRAVRVLELLESEKNTEYPLNFM